MEHVHFVQFDANESLPEHLLEGEEEMDLIPRVQNLQIQNTRSDATVKCLLCAWGSTKESEYHEHCETEEHTAMTLVTGIAIREPIPNQAPEFPEIHYCALCNAFCKDMSMYESHLDDITHSDMAAFLRATSFCRKNIVVGYKAEDVPCFLVEFLKFLNCSPNYCKLCDKQCNGPLNLEDHKKGQKHEKRKRTAKTCVFCNITFVNPELYHYHETSHSHLKMENFMRKMILTENERMRTPQKHTYVPQYAEATPRPSLYYCKLCNIEFNDVEYFRRHRGLVLHQRIERLIRMLSIRLDVEASEDQVIEIISRAHYCELCNVWCSSSTQRYEDHVKTGEHLLRKSKYTVHNWDCSPHKVLL